MRTRLVPLLPVLILPAAVAAQSPPPIYVAPVVPPAFRLLADPAVQKDIGLTAIQKVAADKVREGWAIPAGGVPLGRFGTVPSELFRNAANARTADFLAKGLTKAQRTRLDQILFQLREKEFGAHQALAMAARDLGLRADQVEDVRHLKVQRVEAIDQAVTSGKRFERIKVEVQATNGDTYEKMAEMLSRAQRERLKELRGKAFEPKVDLTALETVSKARPFLPVFGQYDLELHYIVQPTVRTELKLIGGQADVLLKARDESLEAFANGRVLPDWADRLHTLTEKALNELTPEQRARFDQIMMQRRDRISREAVCGHPAAVAALKLTPIQIRDLRDGRPVADVLTRDQLGKLDGLLGPPFDLPSTVKDAYLPAARVPVVAHRLDPSDRTLARRFLALTDRLGLSAEQIKKLRELAEDEPRIRELIHKELSLDDTPPIAGAGRALTAEKAVAARYRAAVEQQCWDTLDPAQQSIARKIFGRGK